MLRDKKQTVGLPTLHFPPHHPPEQPSGAAEQQFSPSSSSSSWSLSSRSASTGKRSAPHKSGQHKIRNKQQHSISIQQQPQQPSHRPPHRRDCKPQQASPPHLARARPSTPTA